MNLFLPARFVVKKNSSQNIKKLVFLIVCFIQIAATFFNLFPVTQVQAAGITTVISTSSVTGTAQPSQMHHIARTSDGTLHSFIQVGTQTATCNVGGSKSGLLWFISTDTGASWACQEQLSSDTTNLMYADSKVDSADNIYLVYSTSAVGVGGSTAYDVTYRKITASNCSPAPCDWTLEAAQTVLDGDNAGDNAGFQFATLELEGSNRVWIAAREYDGTNYQIGVYYSDSLGAAPTWTVSQATLDTATTGNSTHRPQLVRYGSNIGVIYNDNTSNIHYWRFRNDLDSLTSWVSASPLTNQIASETFTALGDTNGNIYYATQVGLTVVLSVFNGVTWSTHTTVSTNTASNLLSLATDGTNLWVFYDDTSGLALLGGITTYKLVYKKCVLPFVTGNCDASATPVVSYHGIFDKYWSLVSSAYTNDTTDAGNTTSADTQIVSSSSNGDIAYFGKTEKFDVVSWDLSTNGSGGTVSWEYWNGSTWSSLSFTASSNTNFTADGWGSFTSPSDWSTISVNGEGSSYYYIRARATANYSVSPVATQFAAIPHITWVSVTPQVVSGVTHVVWRENTSPGPSKARYSSVSTSSTTLTQSETVNIDPKVVGYSETRFATQTSTMRHVVQTSDGTLHAFIQASTKLACGGAVGNNNYGLVWVTSLDSGSTWVCQGQLSSNITDLMYADARVDSSDNIYVVYSVATTGRANSYDVFYRKISYNGSSSWTLNSAQTVLDGSSSGTGYHYATIELQGTTRAWVSTRYYNGTNYGVTVYYSDSLGTTPSWTVSQSTLDTAGNSSTYHVPTMVRFGSKIGVIWNDQATSGELKWSSRADGDSLTSWAAEATVSSVSSPCTSCHSAVGDASGRVYVVGVSTNTVEFSFYNTLSWLTTITLSFNARGDTQTSIATDGTSAWVFYNNFDFATSHFQDSVVYKKCSPPFTSTSCDDSHTVVSTSYSVFDKYWSSVSSIFTNDTTDAASNTGSGDTQMLTGVGDAVYFGKLSKFDNVSWDLTTNGVGGEVVWEYWNGSAWTKLTDFVRLTGQNFNGDGSISFIPNTDWSTTSVNGEGTSYYYVRARVLTSFGTPPVADQLNTAPYNNGVSVLSNISTNSIPLIWTEESAATARVRFLPVPVSIYDPSGKAEIDPNVVGYSDSIGATQPSTMRHLVHTSDGTLHAFVQFGNEFITCNVGGSKQGLLWMISTDSGETWDCQEQLSSDATNLMYADARVDSADNIYLVYSVTATGLSSAYDVTYRKITASSCTPAPCDWSLEAAQTVLDGDGSGANGGYHYATIELEGTTKAWVASREYDGSNARITVSYSSSLGSSPTWTQSIASLDTQGTNSARHIPTLARFGNNIGILYRPDTSDVRWRSRADSDSLTSWGTENTIFSSVASLALGGMSIVGDSSGNVYAALNGGSVSTTLQLAYFNGNTWSSPATVSSSAFGNGATSVISIATDGTKVRVFYSDISSLSTSLSGSRRLVYKECTLPFTASDCDTDPTAVVSHHSTFDKVWLYDASAGTYQNETSDAGNTTSADIAHADSLSLFKDSTDAIYFGMEEKFDNISWDISTNSASCEIAWEYYNGSSWAAITSFLYSDDRDFDGDGAIAFTPYTNWTKISINSETTSYYYVRIRVTNGNSCSTGAIGVQFASIPAIGSLSSLSTIREDETSILWAENTGGYSRVRVLSVDESLPVSDPDSDTETDTNNSQNSTTPASSNTIVSTSKKSVQTTESDAVSESEVPISTEDVLEKNGDKGVAVTDQEAPKTGDRVLGDLVVPFVTSTGVAGFLFFIIYLRRKKKRKDS